MGRSFCKPGSFLCGYGQEPVSKGFCNSSRGPYIILHPGSKGNVPAVPEIRNGTGKVGLSEIIVHGNAEHFRSAHNHVHAP